MEDSEKLKIIKQQEDNIVRDIIEVKRDIKEEKEKNDKFLNAINEVVEIRSPEGLRHIQESILEDIPDDELTDIIDAVEKIPQETETEKDKEEALENRLIIKLINQVRDDLPENVINALEFLSNKSTNEVINIAEKLDIDNARNRGKLGIIKYFTQGPDVWDKLVDFLGSKKGKEKEKEIIKNRPIDKFIDEFDKKNPGSPMTRLLRQLADLSNEQIIKIGRQLKIPETKARLTARQVFDEITSGRNIASYGRELEWLLAHPEEIGVGFIGDGFTFYPGSTLPQPYQNILLNRHYPIRQLILEASGNDPNAFYGIN